MTQDQIETQVAYHALNAGFSWPEKLRNSAKAFASAINELCPESADRTAAIRKVREAVMTANASVACKGK